MFIIQLQCADKCFPQFRKKMQRTAQKCDMAANRLSAGKTADRLIHNSLKDGRGKVFLGGTFVDQWLDIRFCKYTAACGNRIECFVILCIFIQTQRIGLEKRGHLINKRTGTSGADPIHTLFDISVLKINDLRVFAAKLDGYIRLRSIILKGGRHGNDFLYERNTQMLCQSQSAGTGDHRGYPDRTKLIDRPAEKV